MQQQNALIGVAEAAWFPDISLSAMIEYIGPIPLPFSVARSIAIDRRERDADLVQWRPDLGAGRRRARRLLAKRRQLSADGADRVSAGRGRARGDPLSVAAAARRSAARSPMSARPCDVFLNQFQAGTVAFTTVVVAEVQLLADEEAELTARQNLFLASVSLIEALGGGWDTTLLPTPGSTAERLLVLAASSNRSRRPMDRSQATSWCRRRSVRPPAAESGACNRDHNSARI